MLSSRQLLITAATLDVRLKSDILTFVLSRKIEIDEVNQKLFYFENGNK